MKPTALFRFLPLVLVACSRSEANEGPQPQKAFARLENIQIYYEDLAPPADPKADRAVVLVHGWGSDHSCWCFQEPALRDRVRTILIDLPGHGLSSKPPAATYDMDLFAEAVNAVLEDCGIQKAVLVGHSNGVPMIRQFYRRFPKKTMALVAVDGALKPMFSQDQGAAFVKMFSAADYKERAKGTLKGTLGPSTMAAEQKKHIEEVLLNTPQHVLVGTLEGAFDPKIWTEVRFQVPLVVVNAKQPTWTAEYETWVMTLGPDVEYHTLTDVSHFLMMDAPEKFNAILLEFLARVGL